MIKKIKNQYNPDYVSAPGETLEEMLEERGITEAELAEQTGIAKTIINQIINGKAAITPEIALQMELIFGVPTSFWNNRERRYQEFLARQKSIKISMKIRKTLRYTVAYQRPVQEGRREQICCRSN